MIQLSSAPHFLMLAAWFAALADPSRLALLWQLKQGEANVGQLVAATGIGQASVSKHLATLRQAGLVDSRRAGPSVIYRIADPALEQICTLVCDSVAARQSALAAAVSQPFGAAAERASGD